jgi:ketosteroid isomerase-like protein
MRSFNSVARILFLFTACRADPEVLRKSLLEADRAFARETQIRRLEGWMGAFADSALPIRPNQPLVRGKELIRERMGPAFADTTFALTWEPALAEISGSGDLGYTVGLYQRSQSGVDGKTVVSTGKYISIWRRQGNGGWKVVLDTGVPDPPK